MASRFWLWPVCVFLALECPGVTEQSAPSPPKVSPAVAAAPTQSPRAESPTAARLTRAPVVERAASKSPPEDLFSDSPPAADAKRSTSEAPTEPTLALPTKRGDRRESRTQAATSPLDAWPSLGNVAGSLGIVLGVFLAFVWGLRRLSPRSGGQLPKEAFEVLGRAPLAGRRQAQLIRCGPKLLLVSLGAGEVQTLTEISDPAEVDRLAGLCLQSHPTSASAAFRGILDQFAKEPAQGFLGNRQPDPFEALRRGDTRREVRDG
jgi:flagellar biogenesis protein FliO